MISLNNAALKNIQDIVKEKGGTIKFAELLDVAKVTVDRILSNAEISSDNMAKLCEILEIVESDLQTPDFFIKHEPMDIFEPCYSAYSLTYNTASERTLIDKAELKIDQDRGVDFAKILNGKRSKERIGKIHFDDNLISIDLVSKSKVKYHSYIMLLNPKVIFPYKYIGGLGLFLEPTLGEKIPSAKKIILYKDELKELRKEDGIDRLFLIKNLKMSAINDFFSISLDEELYVREFLKNRLIVPG